MLKLPEKSGEIVTGYIRDYFASYANPKVGDFLLYNPYQDKMVVMSINDKPEYAVKSIDRLNIFKRNGLVAIQKL